MSQAEAAAFTEDEDLDLDPFDFTGKDVDVPSLVPDIEWENITNWSPELKQHKNKDGSSSYFGRKSDIAQATLFHLGKPLRLDNHAFMLPIYNDGHPRVVLKCSRQVAKCVEVNTRISSRDGSFVRAGDVAVGTDVASMDLDGHRIVTGSVSWVSEIKRKRMVRIRTRQGHEVLVARTHPIRTWNEWTKAGLLEAGSRIAVVRRCGEFSPKPAKIPLERIRITAYLLGDGYLARDIAFTSIPGPTLSEFMRDLAAVGGSAGISAKKSRAVSARLHRGSVVESWIQDDGLAGSRSGTKFIPGWVFTLSRQQTAIFLNRLWSTDGHVKQNGSMSAFGYASISKDLVLEIQALLWKFGIPSKIRSFVPKLYRGTEKVAYSVRIETLDGARTFLREIGCLGKAEGVRASSAKSNNNRDTYPTEIQSLISEIVASRGNAERFGKAATHSLRSAGMQEKLIYPPTKGRLRGYVDFFREDDRYNQSLVDLLEAHISTELYWDKVVEIEDVGTHKCVDFEVSGTHNFVANGIISHNSTTVCNMQIIESIVHPHWRSLYVSPSALQTRQYSNEKLRPTIYDSPFIRQIFVGKGITDQVFEKTLLNGSYLFLRYAFLTAARARGIPASRVFFDECPGSPQRQHQGYQSVALCIATCRGCGGYGDADGHATHLRQHA